MPYIAQHILQAKTLLPEDVFVNTWHFKWDGNGIEPDIETAADLISLRLQDFYNAVDPTHGSLASHLPDFLTTAAKIKVYHSAEAEPRTPHERDYTLANIAPGTHLPTEVAACLSFYANKNTATTRGRVFLGPLKASASFTAPNSTPRVATSFRDLVSAAAVRMSGSGDGLHWCTRNVNTSTGVTTWSAVTAGWVDDAFDTQRRRGIKASARTVWQGQAL